MALLQEPLGLFALLLAASLIGAWLSDVVRVSFAPILMILGILAGPEFTNLVEGGVVLQILGSIGIVYIFFYSGTEVRYSQKTRNIASRALPSTKEGILQILCWIVLPSLTGVAVGFAIGTSILEALAMGVFFASAGIGSSLMENTAKFTHHSSYGLPRIVAIASIFGVAIISSIIESVDARTSILSCAFSCFFAALILFIFPRIATLFLRQVKASESIERCFLFLLVFAASFLGTFLFVPEWFTAFIAGIALSPVFSNISNTGSRNKALFEDYFSPAAFFFMGVSLQFLDIFESTENVLQLLALTMGGFVARTLSAFLVKRMSAKKEALLGFVLPFTGFSLAIAWLFYRDGLFDAPLMLGALALSVTSSAISKAILTKSISSSAHSPGIPPSLDVAIPNRILVALSKPSSVPHLLDLASILHGSNNQSPLFPLVVRISEEYNEIQTATAENILAHAVMWLSDKKKAVLPLNIEAINPARGIIDAASQKKCDSILIGWNKPPRLSHAFFGSVIDQIVSETSDMVLVARSQFQWSSIKQIFVIVPPYSEMHEGFSAARHCLNRLAEASYATVSAVVQQDSSPATHPFSQKTMTFSSWRDIPELLKPISGISHASVIILSARPGEQSWNPAFERLPHILAESFGQINVLMIYMPSPSKKETSTALGGEESTTHEEPHQGIEASADQSSAILMESIRSRKMHVNMQSSAIAEAVYELIFSALPHADKKDLRALADRCIDVLQKQPIEIEPGVVLLHDRIDSIQYPSVSFGAHKKGFRLSALENPVHILVLILIPKNQSPEDHLRFLANIASLFRTKNLRERLVSANSPEDILA